MFRLPSVLHRQTEDCGHRGSGRQIPPQVRSLIDRHPRPAQNRSGKRAKLGFALFICLPGIQALADDCQAPDNAELHQVVEVFDGDTLLLSSGQRVRLTGIDTPELARDQRPAEPFAQAALAKLNAILEVSKRQIRLQPANDPQDRYGRLLAHAFTTDRRNIQALLLGSGLALATIHPPNLKHLDCYLAAERQARDRRRALWAELPTPADKLNRQQRGLALIRGKVAGIRQTRRSLWIDLQGDATLRIATPDLADFNIGSPADLTGQTIEARGWLSRYRGKPTLRLRHPKSLVSATRINTD